jgi:mannose-6-phosphate isomerase-like protein (cupin superfamily)
MPPHQSATLDAAPAAQRWFLCLPTWISACGSETRDTLISIEQIIPSGFASPWHVHYDEDESFYVIDDTVTVQVADRSVTLNVGDYAFSPRGIPHGSRIEGATPARVLLMFNGGEFANFVRATSKPTTA